MKRRLAREIIVQSLYQMEMNDVEVTEAVDMLIEEAADENETERVITDEIELKAYVVTHVNGVWEHKMAIDDMLEHYLKGWQMSRLSRVDRQILRLATFEMIFASDVPAKVSVNEAIDLAKHFGTEDSGKFVNGVLGKMIQDVDTLRAEL
ncbi:MULTISPECIES: transcription antitermination factor NusB [unclassified Paenibacillus]|uniref:Transcription antitermination protein NusB n=1 Tax=Paenibacillus rhizoplanae TaxID=1917181 RepID=A0ABW5FAU1_9BACL|nr:MULTISPECIES: transcription antitermination factor NusB [unclassified Paenibacillus]ETT44254.1 NusB antitermination factor [Paenibacillus sp. FSL R7-269]ETT59361.1 NusB antitermination factor [Paenibacillus sp. FSL R7-277]OMF94312.1 transcription antitermination factor NusB [Paenibacillus sp. FSL R7-0333]